VAAPNIAKDGYHLFLSHVWGTGQDQMRIVKQRMLEMVPGLSIFLDVVSDSTQTSNPELQPSSNLLVVDPGRTT